MSLILGLSPALDLYPGHGIDLGLGAGMGLLLGAGIRLFLGVGLVVGGQADDKKN